MSKNELAIVGGICTVVGAVTAARKKRNWEDAHKMAAWIGAIVAIAGLASSS